MNYSKYNVVKEIFDDIFIYNTLSGKFFKISAQQFKNIENEPKLLSLLTQAGMITENTDELNNYKYLYNRSAFDTQSLNITIAPTMNCNFNCQYCFEGENKAKSRSKMSKKLEDMIVSFIEKRKKRLINIGWFGGEPLMGFGNIVSITQKLKAKGIEFKASIVTNGSLLTPDKIEKIKDLEINRIQISLDGLSYIHDKRRFFKNNSGSFDIIIDNLKNLLIMTSIPVYIQVAVDKSNINAYHEVLNYFNSNFTEYMGEKLFVGYNLVRNRTGFDDKNICFDHSDELQYRESIDNLKEENKEIKLLPNKSMPCMYRCEDSFVIDPEGYVYKCLEQLGDSSKSIGNLLENKGSLSKLANSFYEEDPFMDDECINCNVFPICGGGCPLDRINNKNKEKNYCSFYKKNLANLLPHFYEQKNN